MEGNQITVVSMIHFAFRRYLYWACCILQFLSFSILPLVIVNNNKDIGKSWQRFSLSGQHLT